jgi:predicted permease
VLPLWAILLVNLAGLPPGQQAVVVAFAALPTASSAYVLATRMGGHGAFVAGLVSLSTLLGMFSAPLALALLQHLQGA